MERFFLALCVFLTHVHSQFSEDCTRVKFDQDSFVCLCNTTGCDTVEPVTNPLPGTYDVYVSTKEGLRLQKFSGKFNPKQNQINSEHLAVKVADRYQSILGFGGAYTDATAINIQNLSIEMQEKLLASYFSVTGIEYSLTRIPMGSCDFSTRLYSYDDTPNDFNLTYFKLAPEDLDLKIKFIRHSISLSYPRTIRFFASPWSSPAWMKTNNNFTGYGTLKGTAGGKYYKAWAKYFVKFIQKYERFGIPIWGVTAQNEPEDGLIHGFSFQCLGWKPEQQRDFIVKDLGPALKANGFGDIKIMILDDDRLLAPYWARTVLKNNPDAQKYVAGIAVHWYEDMFPPFPLDLTHREFPDKFILATEACEQNLFDKRKSVALGLWQRAENYFNNIVQDMNHWVTGWTDWNMALDMQGGPNWAENFADSPIIVNSNKNEFYKQPMFYAMGHFSKFVVPDSQRIGISVKADCHVKSVAFLRPDNMIVVNIGNPQNFAQNVTIHDPMYGYINFELQKHSLQTFLWMK